MKRRSLLSAAIAACVLPVRCLAGKLKIDSSQKQKREIRYDLIEDHLQCDSYYEYIDGDKGSLHELQDQCCVNLVIAREMTTRSIVGVMVIVRRDSFHNTSIVNVEHLLADSHDVRVGLLKKIAPGDCCLIPDTQKHNYSLVFNINNADTESEHTDAIVDAIYDCFKIRSIELGETSVFCDKDFGVYVCGFKIKTAHRVRTKVGVCFILGDDGSRVEQTYWGRVKCHTADYMKAKLTAIAEYFPQSTEYSELHNRVRVAVADDKKYRLAGDKSYRTGLEIWD